MLVHRLRGATGVHGEPLYFRISRRNPSSATGDQKTAAIADQLGITRRDVRALVDRGLLPGRRDERGEVVISGRELDRFLSDLEPVELTEAAPAAAPAAAAPRTPPIGQPAAIPPRRAAARRPARRKLEAFDLEPAEAVAEPDEPDLCETSCPHCDGAIEVQEGTLAAYCPHCQHRLAFKWDDDDQGQQPAPPPEPEMARPFLHRLFAPRPAGASGR